MLDAISLPQIVGILVHDHKELTPNAYAPILTFVSCTPPTLSSWLCTTAKYF